VNHPHHRVRSRGERAPAVAASAPSVAASASAVLLSILASSHHWLHMGILLLFGGSAHAMTAMAGVLWLRRAMVLGTLIAAGFTARRLVKHRAAPLWAKAINALSLAVSLGFLAYTLYRYGW